MRKVDDWDNWEKNRKKEKWRWILTFVVIFVAVSGYFTYVDKIRYTKTTVKEVIEIAHSNYSKELYTAGKIDFVAKDITENKLIKLSGENLFNFLTLLENTTVTGIKKQDTKDLALSDDSYIIYFESNSADKITVFISSDENTQSTIFEIFPYDDNIKLADYYLVQGEELINRIEELIKQAP